MAINPRVVVSDVDVTWEDGATVTHIPRGTIVDVADGSALEAAYGGAGNLRDYVPGQDNHLTE